MVSISVTWRTKVGKTQEIEFFQKISFLLRTEPRKGWDAPKAPNSLANLLKRQNPPSTYTSTPKSTPGRASDKIFLFKRLCRARVDVCPFQPFFPIPCDIFRGCKETRVSLHPLFCCIKAGGCEASPWGEAPAKAGDEVVHDLQIR